jgi:hypothetical protein
VNKKGSIHRDTSFFTGLIHQLEFLGSLIVTFKPLPSSLSADTWPPCAWTMDLAIASPSPEPPCSSRWRDASVR